MTNGNMFEFNTSMEKLLKARKAHVSANFLTGATQADTAVINDLNLLDIWIHCSNTGVNVKQLIIITYYARCVPYTTKRVMLIKL